MKFLTTRTYLVRDLDEQEEDDEHKQVVSDANSSNDDVDDIECEVTDVGQIQRQVVRIRWRGDVVPGIIQQRCVVHL